LEIKGTRENKNVRSFFPRPDAIKSGLNFVPAGKSLTTAPQEFPENSEIVYWQVLISFFFFDREPVRKLYGCIWIFETRCRFIAMLAMRSWLLIYVLMRGPRTVYKFMEFVPEFVFASGFCG